MAAKLITHPETGETLNQKQWAKRIGISTQAMTSRLKKYSLSKALTANKITRGHHPWSQEEEEYLASVYRVPNLMQLWNKVAKKRGWQLRTRPAIESRITILMEKGLVASSRRMLDESDGWLTMTQLADCLACDWRVIERWICGYGLPSYRMEQKIIKVHLQEFVNWAVCPINAGVVAKAVNGNAIAINWLLAQIGNWIKERKPRGISKCSE